MRARVREVEADVAEGQKSIQDITTEMNRQYKAMQESLQVKVTELEVEVQSLRHALSATRGELEEALAQGEAGLAAKDLEIAALKERMEDMANEFGDMLAEALRKMADRIEVSPEGYTPDPDVGAKLAAIAGTMK